MTTLAERPRSAMATGGHQRRKSKRSPPSDGKLVAEVEQVAQHATALFIRSAQPLEVHLHVGHRAPVSEVVPQQTSQAWRRRTSSRYLPEQLPRQSVGRGVFDRGPSPAGGSENGLAVEGPMSGALGPVEHGAVEHTE